jgi:phosphoglycerol transferase MdoB-like AlkP superfamily enzyme
LLIYAPALIEAGINTTYGTQDDILPTIIDIINSPDLYASTGTSLLDQDRRNIKYISGEDDKVYIVGEDLRDVVDINSSDTLTDVQKEALGFNEAIYNALSRDELMTKR